MRVPPSVFSSFQFSQLLSDVILVQVAEVLLNLMQTNVKILEITEIPN